jgi:hypothetical protein
MANFTVALGGTYISPLITPESPGNITTRYIIPYSVINIATSTASGDTVTVTLGSTPTYWIGSRAYAFIASSFTGVSSITMSLGTTTNAVCFLASTSVSAAVGTVVAPSTGINTVASIANAQASASLTTEAIFTTLSTSGFNAVASGQVEIVLTVVDLQQTY